MTATDPGNPTPSHALGENYTKSPWRNAGGLARLLYEKLLQVHKLLAPEVK